MGLCGGHPPTLSTQRRKGAKCKEKNLSLHLRLTLITVPVADADPCRCSLSLSLPQKLVTGRDRFSGSNSVRSDNVKNGTSVVRGPPVLIAKSTCEREGNPKSEIRNPKFQGRAGGLCAFAPLR